MVKKNWTAPWLFGSFRVKAKKNPKNSKILDNLSGNQPPPHVARYFALSSLGLLLSIVFGWFRNGPVYR
jgi:hypothetical protein